MTAKMVAVSNSVIVCAFISCVTIAAMHFGKPAILFWYLLAPALITQCKPNAESRKGD